MKVYLAARWIMAPGLREHRATLAAAGIGCTSSWLDRHARNDSRVVADAEMTAAALEDLRDIMRADAVVLWSSGSAGGGGGRHVEVGYALAMGKPVYVIGERENVFHWHPSVIVLPDLAALLAALSTEARR